MQTNKLFTKRSVKLTALLPGGPLRQQVNSEVDGVIEFRFGDQWCNKMKVKELLPDQHIEWECMEGAADWIGTRLSFFLDQNEGRTRVRFSHAGWLDDGDFFALCNSTWARYMRSLKDYCQSGEGAPFGSPQYRP